MDFIRLNLRQFLRVLPVAAVVGFVIGLSPSLLHLHGWQEYVFSGVLYCLLLVWLLRVVGPLFVAHRAFQRGDYRRSLELSKQLIARDAKDASAYVLASAACINLNECQSAIEMCDQIITMMPKLSLGYASKAIAQVRLGKMHEAAETATMALSINKGWSNGYICRASAYSQLCRYEDAVRDCDSILSKHKKHCQALALRGLARVHLNQRDLAFEDFNQAKNAWNKSQPIRILAWITCSLVYLYIAQGETEKAIDESTKAIEIDPNLDLAWFERARAYAMTKQYERAEIDLQRCLGLLTTPLLGAYVYNERARIGLMRDDINLARAEINKAIKIYEESPEILCTKAKVLTVSGEYDSALVELSKTIALDPHCSEAYWFRHEVFAATG